MLVVIFFFQAEDGIRYDLVTGVQTCALPISPAPSARTGKRAPAGPPPSAMAPAPSATTPSAPASRPSSSATPPPRSEERRVGKEWKCQWSAGCENKYNRVIAREECSVARTYS